MKLQVMWYNIVVCIIMSGFDNLRMLRTYVRIGVHMILDMRTLTGTLIFSLRFFKVFKNAYCLKTYCYISDL